MNKQFEPTFDSLREYRAPEWFRDAKFGIWSHWGPQSVPMFGDWYARNMYIQGTPQYEYHLRHYGHPSKFGYKDLCELWKAEAFDPEALIHTNLSNHFLSGTIVLYVGLWCIPYCTIPPELCAILYGALCFGLHALETVTMGSVSCI